MEVLNADACQKVGAGSNLYITYLIPVNGISESCVTGYIQVIGDYAAGKLTESEACAKLEFFCSDAEIDLILDRADAASLSSASFK